MKKLAALGVIFFALLLCPPGHAANPNANINQGDALIGGHASLSHSEYANSALNLAPEFAYFFIDNLAVGADINVTWAENQTNYSLGPKASYYFWSAGKSAVHVGVEALYYNNEAFAVEYATAHYWIGIISLGYDYFVTPQVSIGANFSHRLPLDNDAKLIYGPSYTNDNLAIAFHYYF